MAFLQVFIQLLTVLLQVFGGGSVAGGGGLDGAGLFAALIQAFSSGGCSSCG